MRSETSGDRTAFTISAFSRSTTFCGVPAVVKTPSQLSTATARTPASLKVGTSGAIDDRFSDATAIVRNLPAFTCGSAGEMPRNMNCTSPDRSAVVISPPLL